MSRSYFVQTQAESERHNDPDCRVQRRNRHLQERQVSWISEQCQAATAGVGPPPSYMTVSMLTYAFA